MTLLDQTLASKVALRRLCTASRQRYVASLSDAQRQQAENALCKQLQPMLRPGLAVASYAAHGSEIDPRVIEAAIDGLAFPRVTPGGLMFHAARFDALTPGYAGIAEPHPEAPRVIPDIVLVPLLAVDARGNRLGQGQGHFDRALSNLRASGQVLAIGLAWEIQMIAEVPADPWDQRLDALATPDRLIRFAA